jgi:hypothetical protein
MIAVYKRSRGSRREKEAGQQHRLDTGTATERKKGRDIPKGRTSILAQLPRVHSPKQGSDWHDCPTRQEH